MFLSGMDVCEILVVGDDDPSLFQSGPGEILVGPALDAEIKDISDIMARLPKSKNNGPSDVLIGEKLHVRAGWGVE